MGDQSAPSSGETPSPALAGAAQAYRSELAAGLLPSNRRLTIQALQLRHDHRYAAHPLQAALRHHRALAEVLGEEGHGGFDFESAESLHRAGAQGLRLSKIPHLPQSFGELSRLGAVDRVGRTHLRRWVETHGPIFDENAFLTAWQAQGRRGGAEHHVYHHQEKGRWFKRLYHTLNGSTLGDYFDRMRLHAVLFPETAYRLEGFTINSKSKALAPVVSQPHVEVDTARPPVSKAETEALMSAMGFAPVQFYFNGMRGDEYFAFLHPHSGVLAHDLHDENVVRVAGTDDLAVIDPFISLARQGTWAALKLAEIGLPPPTDDEPSP